MAIPWHVPLLSGPLAVGPMAGGGETSGEATAGGFVLLVVFALVAIGFSFLCSIAEAVLLSVTPSYIATLQNQGKRSAALLARLKESIDRPLAAILSLNTIAHTVGAAGVGAEAAEIWGSRSVGLVSAVMTLLILVLSEIIPKTIGAVYWRALAAPVAQGVQLLVWALLPLVWLSDLLTKLIAGSDTPKVVTREEVAALATLGAKGGALDKGETRILHNLFRLEALTVEDVMTPRIVMIAFPEAMTVGELFEQQPKVPVSRIPVYGDGIDDVTGMVLAKDLMLAQAEGKLDARLAEFRRELPTVPWTAPLKRLFDELLERREHIALVVDEYGGTDGLVTLEDVIETLLGMEIVDESDTAADMQQFARRQWRRRAKALGLNVDVTDAPPEQKPDRA